MARCTVEQTDDQTPNVTKIHVDYSYNTEIMLSTVLYASIVKSYNSMDY